MPGGGLSSAPFQVEEVLGVGAYGVVCVLRREDGSRVAAKVLRPGASRAGDRLRDEARLLFQLRHPNIVRGEGLLEVAGRPIVLMEYVRGVDLWTLLHALDGMPVNVALAITAQVSSALHYAWSEPADAPLHLVHRDLKPNNLLLDANGVVKILDLGTARGAFAGREARTVDTVLGTRGYMAPERRAGVSGEPGVDVYGLGVTLFQLITARMPLLSHQPRRHDGTVADQIAHFRRRLERDSVPDADAVESLVRDMLRVDLDARPSHLDVVARCETWLAVHGAPDLVAFAQQMVVPRLAPPCDPRGHAVWDELSQLEVPWATSGKRDDPSTMPVAVVRTASEEANGRVARMVSEPGWATRAADVLRLLERNPAWSDAPFVAVVAPLVAPWWRRLWGRLPTKPEALFALERIAQRPSDEGIRVATSLKAHRDPDIRSAALKILGR